jgi:hypothetical protein
MTNIAIGFRLRYALPFLLTEAQMNLDFENLCCFNPTAWEMQNAKLIRKEKYNEY